MTGKAFAVAVLACLLPSFVQGQELALTNVRNTYGELGGTRLDTKFLPGDVMFVGFDIVITVVAWTGKRGYTMGMEASDKQRCRPCGKDPAKAGEYLPLGGEQTPRPSVRHPRPRRPSWTRASTPATVTATDESKPGVKKTTTCVTFDVPKK